MNNPPTLPAYYTSDDSLIADFARRLVLLDLPAPTEAEFAELGAIQWRILNWCRTVKESPLWEATKGDIDSAVPLDPENL